MNMESKVEELGDLEDLKLPALHLGPEDTASMKGMLKDAEEQSRVVDLLRELDTFEFDSKPQFNKVLNKLKNQNSLSIKNSEIRRVYHGMIDAGMLERDPMIDFFLRTKVGKSASGILSVTVFTSPYPKYTDKNGKQKVQKFTCAWNCYYCPNHPDHPRSYLPDEPGCLRAERCGFDPIRQVHERVGTLQAIGHPVDKLEVLVLGGTWESYPKEYQESFIRDLFYAANTFFDLEPRREPFGLEEELEINEGTRCKIIGLTLETRPDTINPESIREFRRFGCTRLQIGIQHTSNDILDLINRQHTYEDSVNALKLLKDNCFKVDIHLMPDLPGASPEIDRDMFDDLLGADYKEGMAFEEVGVDQFFEYNLVNPDLQADQWKIYPCEVTPWTVIEKWYEEGKYQPYGGGDGPELIDLIIHVKEMVFPWIRLNRIIRDIPNQHILGGNANTNLRQFIQNQMKKEGKVCHCIRCREVGLNTFSRQDLSKAQLVVRRYETNGGVEYFLSFESADRRILYGFLRLRHSPDAGVGVFPVLENSALIRELHVYGQLIPTYSKKNSHLEQKHQHVGFGKRLMEAAERISIAEGFEKIGVIAGIGTRNYYRRLGYELEDTFLVKDLSKKKSANSGSSLMKLIIVPLFAIVVYILISYFFLDDSSPSRF